MGAPIILAEKLRRPELSGLSRPRLERPWLAASGRGLDLVVAPPGSGKTTLLAHLAALVAEPVAWYRVTADEAAEAAFTAHLARTLHEAVGLVSPPDEAGDDPMTDLLARLDAALVTPCLLVLDDLHEISGSPAERALERFVALRPPMLRIVIGSRRQPGINVSRLRVSGLLREITGDDLRFRSWEVEELFVGVFGEPLSPESAAALTRRTGGWAAALQLFHLATAARSAAERAQVITDLGGRSRLIRSYLTRNVLAELPEDRRTFLVRTSTLGTLTGELCDALLEITGSALILDDLEQRQLFTTSDDDGHTFRYHEVLRTHLELALAEEYGTAGARAWYSRSAALLEAAGEQRAALRAHARAEDWPAVARLVREWKVEAGTEPPLPARMVETDPWLALVEARRLLRGGAVAAAVLAFRRAENLLDEPEFQQGCRRERAAAAVWATDSGVERAAPPGQGHWAGRIRSATRAIAAPALQPAAGRPEESLATGVSALLAGDLRAATSTLDPLTTVAGPPTITLLARCALAVAQTLAGSAAAGSADSWGQLAADADADGLPWLARLARGLHEVMMMSQDPQDWRLAVCAALPDDCDQAGDAWGAAVLRLAGAVAQHIFGGVEVAQQFAEAAGRFAALDAPVLGLWADVLGLFATHRSATDAATAADSLVREARKRGVPGVEALALAAGAVLSGSSDQRQARAADELAGRCGLRAAVLALMPPSPVVGGLAAISNPVPPQRVAVSGRVQLRCFGGFRMDVDGHRVDLSSLRPRSCALLRLMALSPGKDLHREWLIEALWPEADLVAGTRRLQVAISSIRQVFEHAGISGADTLRRHGDTYQLALPTGSTVDVVDFERAIAAADTAARRGDVAGAAGSRDRALALYQGDLLPEDGSTDPIVGTRDRLRLAAAAVAAAAAAEHARLADPDRAMTAARRAVELDPYQDPPWRLIIDMHEAAGDASAAERARQEHVRVRAELGVG